MAKIFGKDFGLDPAAGSGAKDFADSMDQAAKASEKIKLENDLGLKSLNKALNTTQKLVDEAKLNQKLLEKRKKDQIDHAKMLAKQGASIEKRKKAELKIAETHNKIAEHTKTIQENSEKITNLTEEKAELDEIVTKELEKQNKIGNLINIGAAVLVGLIAELFTRQSQVREEMGLTVAQTNKLLPVVQDVSAELTDQGINFEKSSAAAKAIYDSTKNLSNVTAENVKNVSLVSQKFGIAVTDTTAIAQTMKEIGGYSMEQSTNMIAFASAASEAAGVAPAAVMADIAGSAETAAKYFGDNPKALAKAAIEARRLGLTLDDMAGVAGGLLDIESSIENQFTAQVLTGKNLNFDAARRLALEGDIEGATKAILGQMGSIDEFNKMDVIQKEAVAAAAGLTVTQLSTSLTKQKALNDMTDEQKAKYEKLLGDMDTANQSEADKLLKQTESLAMQEKFNASIDSLKEILLESIMPAFEAVTPIIENIFNWIGSVAGFLRESKVALLAMAGAAGLMVARSTMLAGIEFQVAVAKMFAANAPLGPIGVISALAGVAAMVGAFSMMDDMVSPGYGQRVLSSPEGNIALNDKDTIVAGTNLGGGGGNSALIAKMDELIRVVKTAKPLNIDGNKVGEAIYLGNVQSGAA